MAKPSRSEQLNKALDALLASGNSSLPVADAQIAPLLRVAASLRDLPRPDFKARLKADLQRRTSMASTVMAAAAAPQTVTVYLSIKNAAAAIEFYKKAFGATELMRLDEPGGKVAHAQIRIGNSEIMIADEYPDWRFVGPQTLGGSPVRISLLVDDVDALGRQAVAAGAKVVRPIQDEFYGYRQGQFSDPFGYTWSLRTLKEVMTPEELQRRFNDMMRKSGSAATAPKKPVGPVPKGFHTVTPYVMVAGGAAFIDFTKQAFGAVEMYRFAVPNSHLLMHAAIRIGDSIVELADATPEHPASPMALHLYVENTDELYDRALAAGATSIEAPADKPYGDRSAGVRDAFGNQWFIATHIRDLIFEGGKMREAGEAAPETESPAEESKPRGSWIRKGFHTITPYITVKDAPELVDFMTRVFGAEETFRDVGGAGGYHYEMKLGDSMLMVGGGLNFQGTPMPTNLWTYVKDVDAIYERALAAGGIGEMPPKQMDYGERGSTVRDAYGNNWYIATYNEPGAKSYIREGLGTVTPYLHIEGAAAFIDFVKQGFGGEELYVGKGPGGKIVHAQLRVGDSVSALSDATPAAPPRPTMLYLYTEDADALYRRAMAAGATSIGEPKDQPYGDRVGGVKDAMGNQWFIATHIKNVAS
jgi:PhnB protein